MDVGSKEETHGEEGVDDVCLYRAERFVSDHNEDLLLLLQVDEVTEPRLLSQSEGTKTDRDHDWFQNISSTCSHQYTSDNLFYLDKNWQNMDRSWSHYFFVCFWIIHGQYFIILLYSIDTREKLDSNGITHSGEESGVRLDMSSWVGTVEIKVQSYIGEI